MGPRSFDRGDLPSVRPLDGGLDVLQWGRDLSIAETRACKAKAYLAAQGFNGAAIFRSRRLTAGHKIRFRVNQLQWGRDLSIAETSGNNLAMAEAS